MLQSKDCRTKDASETAEQKTEMDPASSDSQENDHSPENASPHRRRLRSLSPSQLHRSRQFVKLASSRFHAASTYDMWVSKLKFTFSWNKVASIEINTPSADLNFFFYFKLSRAHNSRQDRFCPKITASARCPVYRSPAEMICVIINVSLQTFVFQIPCRKTD